MLATVLTCLLTLFVVIDCNIHYETNATTPCISTEHSDQAINCPGLQAKERK